MWCKKVKTSGKWKAKKLNNAFAWQFTWGCKFEGKCSIYYLCPWFNRCVHFFCTKLVKSKFGSNQIFRAVFAASGSDGLQVLFSGTGFVCCQGSPFFPHWLVSSPRCGSQTSQQSCWSSYTENEGSIVEVFPSITCVTIVRTWKRFLKRTCKFFDFTLFTGFAHVKARPPLLFCVIQLLWWQFCSATHQGRIRIAFSTPIAGVWWEAGQTGAGA